MARIKIIIADTDAAYVSSLGDFLIATYPLVFEVVSFSRREYLERYLLAQESTGILLIIPELVKPDFAHPGLMQILLEATPSTTEPGIRRVFKYLKGPDLVQHILKIYSECEATVITTSSSKKAKVVAIYSPAGGVGKTTLAVGCSLQTAWEGNSVFYLNLEDMPSTEMFFASAAEGGLSTAFYYLQEKKKNLNIKIASLKKTDPHSQIHYFTPTDSVLDLCEDLGAALTTLVQLLSDQGAYDYIFIDLSSQFNPNNIAILEASDVVLLISTPEPICQLKVKLLQTELTRYEARSNSCIQERIYPVLNKCEPGSNWDAKVFIEGREPLAKIPKVSDLLLSQGELLRLDLNGPFGTALYQVRASFKT